MKDEREQEIIFVPEEEYKKEKIKAFFENLWDDIVFHSTILWYITKGYFLWFISIGSVEIEIGYEENGESKNILFLEKLW